MLGLWKNQNSESPYMALNISWMGNIHFYTVYTVMFSDRSGQTVKTQIRLIKEQSDQGGSTLFTFLSASFGQIPLW